MSLFYLPDLGEGLQEAEIIAWHVGEGDRVVTDQPLVAVETDKAVVDIPAPYAGRIARLLAKPGEHVAVGAALVAFSDQNAPDAGAVVGTLAEAPPLAPALPADPPPRTSHPVRAAPAARALAQRLGIELSGLLGSGPQGLITTRDVEMAQTAPSADAEQVLSGVRRAMAQRMVEAHRQVVPATITDLADIEAWAEPAAHQVTLRLVQAIAAACQAEPALNASFDGEKLTRRLNRTVDLGIATDTPDGLFVPVLNDVAGRSASDLQQDLDRLKADVLARRIPPRQLRGQTITLSNFGMIGGRFAQMVVVPPQVAIVGAGAIRAEPVAVGGQMALHRRLPISLSFDHRAVAGGEAARFLARLIAHLEA
ncbi:MAG TPA: 2-oxo acid dehydrogenase subunit E2 [Rhodospirillaceae bacterium]|nr:2-oxo acid dehydrogenase subunit E2 [Rhodospirillaceae bacterium]